MRNQRMPVASSRRHATKDRHVLHLPLDLLLIRDPKPQTERTKTVFPVTITLNTISELNAVMAALHPTTPVQETAAAPVEKPSTSAATTAGAARSPRTAATTAGAARSPRTAAAAAETAAPVKTAAESTPTAASAVAEPQASTAAPEVAYADLQKVILKLHAKDPSATQAIAKGMGLDNFKPLKEDDQGARRAEALKLIEAKLASLEG